MSPSRMGGVSDIDSEEDIRSSKKKTSKSSRHKSRSRSPRPSRHQKKHKKEKKKKKRRSGSSSAGDTGGEGGDTPTRLGARAVTPLGAIPGIDKYQSDHSDDEADLRRKDDSSRKRKRSRSKNRKRSRSRDRKEDKRREKYSRDDHEPPASSRRKVDKDEEMGGGGGMMDDGGQEGGGTKEVLSLSIEETNKLRAKLGLKPLNVNDKNVEEEDDGTQEGTLIPGDRNKTRHLPAEHWGEKAKESKLREKLSVRKERRSIADKLAAVKGLADSDSDDDAEKWIQKQKSKVEAKKEAEKLAKQMEDLDNEFGVADLVSEKLATDRKNEYSAKNLRGLRVEHNFDRFSEKETVLTLKDQDILDENYEDVLVNVNIKDDEKAKKNIENIRAGKDGYKAYDQEDVDELTGEVTRKEILHQYNEEIDGEKRESFVLEGEGQFNEEEVRARELAKIRQKLKLGNMQTLETPQLRLASDYYNDEEMSKFKKPKGKKDKKKKIRKKMLKADDLLKMQNPDSLLPADFGNTKKKRVGRIIDDDEDANASITERGGGVVYDDLPVVEDLSDVKVEYDDVIGINDLLKKAQKLKNKKEKRFDPSRIVEEMTSMPDDVEMEEDDGPLADDLVLEETEEFCRNLGENVFTYEASGMKEDVDSDLLDFEQSLQPNIPKMDVDEPEASGSGRKGGWEAVGANRDGSDSDSEDESRGSGGGDASRGSRPAILDEEALAGSGMGAALKIAMQMGYLEKEQLRQKSTGLQELVCKKYNIEDKSRDYEEDDRKRRGGRDRGYSGPTTTFAEKKGYKPEVVLEYVDDSGRELSSKEAFRYLSHKFHGKTSGKLKTEKRQRKVLEDQLMRKMSSTDTPLQTLQKQQEKSKELATPYLVLSGNKQISSLKK